MCIKFCLKLGRTATGTYQALKIVLRKGTDFIQLIDLPRAEVE
jgi:hypothetical protein